MKFGQTGIILIVVGAFLAFFAFLLFAYFVLFRSTMRLPNRDAVTSITVGSISLYNRDTIDDVLLKLSTARRVSLFAMNDTPFAPDSLGVYIYGMVGGEEVMMVRLYLYTENGNTNIWNSYVGVYRISRENSDWIRKLYKTFSIPTVNKITHKPAKNGPLPFLKTTDKLGADF